MVSAVKSRLSTRTEDPKNYRGLFIQDTFSVGPSPLHCEGFMNSLYKRFTMMAENGKVVFEHYSLQSGICSVSGKSDRHGAIFCLELRQDKTYWR